MDLTIQLRAVMELAGGDIVLSNVDFINVQPSLTSTASAVVLQSATCTLMQCGTLKYDGGLVSFVNNGYEFRSDLTLNPFLYASSLDSVTLTNVRFEYVIAVNPSANSGVLVLSNFQTLVIANCSFHDSIIAGSVILLQSTVTLPRDLTYEGYTKSINQTHIRLESVNFTRTFATGGVLKMTFAGDLLNILLTKVRVQGCAVSTGALVTIGKNTEVSSAEVNGGFSSATGGLVTPRWVNITQSSFLDNVSFASVLSLANLANLLLDSLQIASNGSTEETMMNALLQLLISNSKVYAETAPVYGSDALCDGMVTLDSVFNTDVRHINISSNVCSAGGTGIVYQNTTGSNSVDTMEVMYNNASKDTANGLDCYESVAITVSRLTAIGNRHADRGIVHMRDSGKLLLQSSVFSDNEGFSGAGVYSDGAINVTVLRSQFTSNSAPLSSGGAIYFIASALSPPSFSVFNCDFRGNTAQRGGAISVSFTLSTQLLSLQVATCKFANNHAEISGSSFYAGSTASFDRLAVIEDCEFDGESSPGGVFGLFHVAGELTIARSNVTRCSGTLASGVYMQTTEAGHSTLDHVLFQSNRDGPAISKPNSRISASFSTHYCTFIDNNQTCVFMESGQWVDRGSLFKQNFHSSAVEIAVNASATVISTVFEENQSDVTGGAVSLQSASNMTCSGCVFRNNRANSNGGGVFLEQSSYIDFSDCEFTANTVGAAGSALYLLSLVDYSYIRRSIFSANRADQSSTISVQSAYLVLEEVKFEGNEGGQTPGVELLLSNLTMIDSDMKDQYGSTAAFISLQISSNATISRSRFIEGSGVQSGAIYMSSSQLEMNNVSFLSVHGSLLSCSSLSNLTLSGLTVSGVYSDSDGSLISGTDCDIYIASSSFANYGAGGIRGTQTRRVYISDSEFANATGQTGVGIYCVDCGSVEIYRSTFRNHSGSMGTLYLQSAETSTDRLKLTIANCSFQRNSARDSAGVLYASNIDYAITGSEFIDNAAVRGDAGVLLSTCAADCSAVVEHSHFRNNSASAQVGSGGCVRWEVVKPQTDVNVTYKDNSAFYGNNIASFPVGLKVEAASASNSSRQLASPTSIGASIAPGQKSQLSLLVSLIDHYGQTVRTNSLSNAELISTSADNATVSGTVKVQAKEGVFKFDDFLIYAAPESQVELNVSTDAVAANQQESEKLDIRFVVNIRGCVPGESKAPQSCLVCAEKTYSFDPKYPCQNCLANTDCLGNMTVIPLAGYWRPSKYSERVLECPRRTSCLGGSDPAGGTNISFTGYCAEGYQGHLCQSCVGGYFLSGSTKCQKCPSHAVSILQSVLIYVGIGIVIAVLVYSALRSALRAAAVHSVYLKILVNYSQLVFLVADFKLNWPDEVLSMFEVQKSAGGASDLAISLDCFYRDTGNTIDNFYNKRVWAALLPLLGVFVSLLVWLPIALIKRNMSLMKRQFAATIVIIFFFIHPTLVRSLFSLFSCTELETGEYWVTSNPNIRCWEGRHALYLAVLGVPGVLVWVVGVPFLCLGILIKYRKQHTESWLKQTYGFLINGYHRSRFFWEFVILYRKIAIICCSVFFTGDYLVQALTVLVILLFYLFLQHRIHPYTTQQMNRLELCAILVACVTIYSGLFFLSKDLDSGGSWLFFICICLANILFLLYWVWEMLIYIVTTKISKAFRSKAPGLTDAYMKQFTKQYTAGERATHFPCREVKEMYRLLLEVPISFSYLPPEVLVKPGYRRLNSVATGEKRYIISNIDDSEIEHLGRSYKNPRESFASLSNSLQKEE